MERAGGVVKAFAEEYAIGGYEHCADGRVGTRAAESATRKAQGAAHPAAVVEL
jgi:hypothetical protein